MQPPSVVIAANPYEAELCRRALVDTGLQLWVADGGEGALERVREARPLVLVVALGLIAVDSLELIQEARGVDAGLPIFLLGDRGGEVDDAAAARLGVSRLFLRPIEVEALADAIEKRAVAAELGDAAPAAAAGEPDAEARARATLPLARVALRRVPREPTQVLSAAAREGREPAERLGSRFDDRRHDGGERALADEPELRAGRHDGGSAGAATETLPLSVELTGSATRGEPLLRADDALDGVGLQSLVESPDFVRRVSERNARAGSDAPAGAAERHRGEAARAADPSGDEQGAGELDERGSFARRLQSELSAAERRLFPNSPSTASDRAGAYEDVLGDIDLDALAIDTIPGIGADALEGALELKPRHGRGHGDGEPEPPIVSARADAVDLRTDVVEGRGGERASRPALPDEEGDLAAVDVAVLVATLHGAGFSGALTLARGDGDKTLFFDDGLLVGARSAFVADRLAELLIRDGTIGREAQARLHDLPDGGRRAALQLVERGLIKSSELFAVLRRHVEEIFYSCFAWERGRYRLGHELPAADDRVRMGSHPWALILEGVRRKYGLERLSERVGTDETVLAPTTVLAQALDDCALTAAERARAELIDGERSLAELQLAALGAPLAEAELYALAWSLVAIGAVRVDGEEQPAGSGMRALPTLVTTAAGDRRRRPRPLERERDRDADRAVDKERVLAKRAQVDDGDYFIVLGLGRDASAHEVARAFERLKREFAPERFADPLRQELAQALSEIGAVLDEAHRVLADDRVRNSYRDHLPPA